MNHVISRKMEPGMSPKDRNFGGQVHRAKSSEYYKLHAVMLEFLVLMKIIVQLTNTLIEVLEANYEPKLNQVKVPYQLKGERLLTMSCSDKICRWNVLGLQGALLSHFVEPIYLKSVVLGSLMKENHLYRAICGRIESSLQGLPPPYLLNRPMMLRKSQLECRQPQKAPNFAVIWLKGMDKPEIVNTVTGKPDQGISAVSKRSLVNKFVALCGKVSSITGINAVPPTYCEAKEAVRRYTAAKECLYEAFEKACLGKWVSKPLEQDMFHIDD
ncbi:hypothetical protein NQ315_012778 [Exocentrus adspersus]|uniref:A to I editase domain-containing protein n=1 Tax=Exocentrus adspersus TaxID=1586481 RepID=A0AAV8VD77_9CUCU|nr:hypothetical protein NQ315_012778 [Exocentrus adspersus]